MKHAQKLVYLLEWMEREKGSGTVRACRRQSTHIEQGQRQNRVPRTACVSRHERTRSVRGRMQNANVRVVYIGSSRTCSPSGAARARDVVHHRPGRSRSTEKLIGSTAHVGGHTCRHAFVRSFWPAGDVRALDAGRPGVVASTRMDGQVYNWSQN